MPPPTRPPGGGVDVDSEIERLIDRLDDFGDRFAELIEELRGLQEAF